MSARPAIAVPCYSTAIYRAIRGHSCWAYRAHVPDHSCHRQLWRRTHSPRSCRWSAQRIRMCSQTCQKRCKSHQPVEHCDLLPLTLAVLCSKQVRFSLMAPGEVVSTAEVNVYQGQLFHVNPAVYYHPLPQSAASNMTVCAEQPAQLAAGRPNSLCWWTSGPSLGTLTLCMLRPCHVTIYTPSSKLHCLCRVSATDQLPVRHVDRNSQIALATLVWSAAPCFTLCNTFTTSTS